MRLLHYFIRYTDDCNGGCNDLMVALLVTVRVELLMLPITSLMTNLRGCMVTTLVIKPAPHFFSWPWCDVNVAESFNISLLH